MTSAVMQHYRPYEQHPHPEDDDNLYEHERLGLSDENLAWYSLDPYLGNMDQYRTQVHNNNFPSTYDPKAHGFTGPLMSYQCGFSTTSYAGHPYTLPQRYPSPVSAVSLPGTGSASGESTTSPDLATTPILSTLSNPQHMFAPSRPHSLGSTFASPPTTTVHPSGFQSFHSQTFSSMRELDLSYTGQSDSFNGYGAIIEESLQLPETMVLSQAHQISDSSIGQSIGDDYPSVSQDSDMDESEHDTTLRELESDDEPEFHAPQNPSPAEVSPARISGRRPKRGSVLVNSHSVQDPNARVQKTTRKTRGHKAAVPSKYQGQGKRSRTGTSASRTPLPCPFHHFGCEAKFPSKNEWKRHALSQHLQLGYWRCDLGRCSEAHPSGITITRGFNDFNRKDLFTQHCRRMHAPESWNGKEYLHASKKEKDTFDMLMEKTRTKCWLQKREPPEWTECGFCRERFHEVKGGLGARAKDRDAWEMRMEHVAKHYERDGETAENEQVDEGLREWCVMEGLVVNVDGRWLLVGKNPNEDTEDAGVTDGSRGSRRKGKSGRSGVTPTRVSKRVKGRGGHAAIEELDTELEDVAKDKEDELQPMALEPVVEAASPTPVVLQDDEYNSDTDADGEVDE